ncbi:proteinase-activated receptor 1-like [Rana temporaria]|uniref:proteinase-activated receptor 1-like n=1 Tax=Rana temporaria TaxID=8407 RepID=UPI001AADC0C1|nr:proteinase-activated receptor 1-like [Rana temporaria]
MTNMTIPSPPITEAIAICDDGIAELILAFPEGDLSLVFIENKKNNSFHLGAIEVWMIDEEGPFIFAYESIEALVTPLGHSITRKEVMFRVSPIVSVVLMDFKAQGFELDRDNIRRDDESTFIIYDSRAAIYQAISISSRHWSVTILAPSIYTVVFLVALPLNIMAIVVFLMKVKVKTPTTVYMLNLAAADVLLISTLPFYIVYRFLRSNWIFGEGMCRFVTTAFYCNMYCSVLLMTSISVDRFLAVVFPMRSVSWRKVSRAWVACGVIWVISLASTVPLLIREQTMVFPMLNNTMCHDIQHFGVYFFFNFQYFRTVFSLFNFLPLFITTFCYVGIICSLSRSKFDRTHKRSRAIRLSVVVLCVFVLCFGPTNVIYLIHYKQVIDNYDFSLYIAYILSSSFSSINCCLDPLIYYFASSECQKYVYSLLRWKKGYPSRAEEKWTPVHKEQSLERTYFVQFAKSGIVI